MNLNFPEDVSYIRSRDPSIQNFNWKNLKNVRVNLQFSVNEKSVAQRTFVEGDNSCIEEDEITIPIYLRVKPSSNAEDYIIHEKQLVYRTLVKNKEAIYKKIEFSKIFNVNSRQHNIFDEIVKVRVFEFLNGKDTTVFTFGTPGAGKTYTTIGTPEEPGFFPRTLEYIFKTLPELPDVSSVKPTPEGKVIRLSPEQKRFEYTLKAGILRSQRATDRQRNIKSYQAIQDKLRTEPYASLEQLSEVSLGVWVSFVEISNEEIHDLLQRNIPINGDKKKLRLGMSNGKPYIKDLTYLCVSSGLEAYQVYQYGAQKLKNLKTGMRCSNRSHSIFTIKIAHTLANRDTSFVSCLNICNLAGADGTRGANDRDRSKECNSINNSLLVLGKCINELLNSLKNPNIKHIIPYRDSKLTQIFQRALSGLEDFCIIVNIDSSKEAIEETHSVLNFSALTKEIISKDMVMKYVSSNQSRDFFQLDEELKTLEEALDDRKSGYLDLKRKRPNNFEIEEEGLRKGWEEIFNDSKALFHRKKQFLLEECEKLYQMEMQNFKHDMKKKIEKNKTKLSQNLKGKCEDNEKNLKNSNETICQLEKKLKKIKDLLIGIENRNKLISEYERIIKEKMEMDSFLFNEICCEGKDSIVVSAENTDESIHEVEGNGEVIDSDHRSSNLDDIIVSDSEIHVAEKNISKMARKSEALNSNDSSSNIDDHIDSNSEIHIVENRDESIDEMARKNESLSSNDCSLNLNDLIVSDSEILIVENTDKSIDEIAKKSETLNSNDCSSNIDDHIDSNSEIHIVESTDESIDEMARKSETLNSNDCSSHLDELIVSDSEILIVENTDESIDEMTSELSVNSEADCSTSKKVSSTLNSVLEQNQYNTFSMGKNECGQQNSMIVDYNISLINEESLPELVTTLEQTQMDKSSTCKEQDCSSSLINEESSPELVTTMEQTQIDTSTSNEADCGEEDNEAEKSKDEGINESICSVNTAENSERKSESLSSEDFFAFLP